MLNEDINNLMIKISDAEEEIELKDRDIQLNKKHSSILENSKSRNFS